MTQGSGQEPHGHCTRGTTREHARSPFPRHGSMQPPQTPRPFSLGRSLSDALWGEGKPNGAQPPAHPTGSSWGQGEMVTSRADPTPGLLPALNELHLGPSSDIQGAALLLGHGLIWGWLLTPNPLSMQRHGQAMASHRVAKVDVGRKEKQKASETKAGL